MPSKSETKNEVMLIVDDAIESLGIQLLPQQFTETLATVLDFQSRIVNLVIASGLSRYQVDQIVKAVYEEKGGGQQLKKEQTENRGKMRHLELRGETEIFSLLQIPGSDTISISTNNYSWLGVIGINYRTGEAWGYPLQNSGLDTQSWGKLIREAMSLFRNWGGVDSFNQLPFISVNQSSREQVDRDNERKNLTDEINDSGK